MHCLIAAFYKASASWGLKCKFFKDLPCSDVKALLLCVREGMCMCLEQAQPVLVERRARHKGSSVSLLLAEKTNALLMVGTGQRQSALELSSYSHCIAVFHPARQLSSQGLAKLFIGTSNRRSFTQKKRQNEINLTADEDLRIYFIPTYWLPVWLLGQHEATVLDDGSKLLTNSTITA